MGLGEVAIAALPTGICPKPAFSDGLGGYLLKITEILRFEISDNLHNKINTTYLSKRQ